MHQTKKNTNQCLRGDNYFSQTVWDLTIIPAGMHHECNT